MGLQSLVPIIANRIQFKKKQRTHEIRCKGTIYFPNDLKFVTLQTHKEKAFQKSSSAQSSQLYTETPDIKSTIAFPF